MSATATRGIEMNPNSRATAGGPHQRARSTRTAGGISWLAEAGGISAEFGAATTWPDIGTPLLPRVGLASDSARSRRPMCGPRVEVPRVHLRYARMSWEVKRRGAKG